jgi:GDPmannose 4,6-dehydratase
LKKALIIGVSGQDGAYLARYLLEKQYEVHGTSRDHEVSAFANLRALGIKERVHLASMDTSDFRSVLTVLQDVAPDEIYNLAGQTSVGMSFTYPVETFDSILIGTMNLLECIRLTGKSPRFYNAGSSEAFGETLEPATETSPFNPRSPYATAKAAAHYAVSNYREAYGLFAATGVLFNHESPLRPERFVTRKIVASAVRIAGGSKETLKLGNRDVYRDWGWAPDYVDAMWRILQQDEPSDFVVATGKMHSLAEFTERVFCALGLDPQKHVCYEKQLQRPLDVKFSFGDPSKAKRVLGWAANVQFDELVKKLVSAEEQMQSGEKPKLFRLL